MLHLSRLILDLRSREARRDEGNFYEMHSTLMRLFSHASKEVERMLFRLEPPTRDRPPIVLIQSRTRPDFSALPRGYCLHAECRDDYGEKLRAVVSGQRLAFRLLANPTCRETLGEGDAKRKRRKPLLDWQAQEAWLRRKLADEAGAQLVGGRSVILDTQRNEKRGSRSGEGAQTHVPVLFEGVLAVDDPDRLRAAIENGIGSAKGYGFGLLSIAPA